jgi:hypothetical protein
MLGNRRQLFHCRGVRGVVTHQGRHTDLDVDRGHMRPVRRGRAAVEGNAQTLRRKCLLRSSCQTTLTRRWVAALRSGLGCGPASVGLRQVCRGQTACRVCSLDFRQLRRAGGVQLERARLGANLSSNRHQGAPAVSAVPMLGCENHACTSSRLRICRNSSWPHIHSP